MPVIFNDPNRPGKQPSASRLNRIERNQEQLSRFTISGGQGTASVSNSSGTHVYVSGGGSTYVEPNKGGIVNELYTEYTTDRIYRLNERVVYKPSGATYYYIYQCLVADTVNTTPSTGDTAAWDLITNCPTGAGAEWSDVYSYNTGERCMAGTPYQMSTYTSLITGNSGNDPTDTAAASGKWEYVESVILGLKEWPGSLESVIYYTPFAEYVVTDVRYDATVFKLSFGHSKHSYNKAGELTGVTASDYVIFAEPQECG